MTPVLVMSGVVTAIAVALLAAAVTRRLHDSGRRGYWGLAPLPFLAVWLGMFPALVAEGDAASDGLLMMLFLNNLIYLGALVLLVVLLIRRGDVGDNRFGPSAR